MTKGEGVNPSRKRAASRVTEFMNGPSGADHEAGSTTKYATVHVYDTWRCDLKHLKSCVSSAKGKTGTRKVANAVLQKERSNRCRLQVMRKQTKHDSGKRLLLLCIETNDTHRQFMPRTVINRNRERRKIR